MTFAETVAHLHHAMKWDFQLLVVANGFLTVILVVTIALFGRDK